MRYLKVFFLISCIAIFTAACGSSGGNSSSDGSASSNDSTIQYTGLTTQATINEDNARDISAGSYQGGTTSSALTASGVIQSENTVEIGRPRTVVLSQIFEDALQKVDIASHSTAAFSGAKESSTETIAGDCGGEATINISYDDVTGDFNGTMNFNGYCSEGAVISGSVDFSGKLNVNTGDPEYLDLSFNDVSTVSGGDSFTISGTMKLDCRVSPERATVSMLMKDNVSGKVYKLENFIMTSDEKSGYVDITMSGRFYDPDYGYVELSTPVAFRFYDGDEWPSQGELFIDGNSGIAGGSTSAQLIAVSPSLCEINADTDGDGELDDYSVQIPWTEL